MDNLVEIGGLADVIAQTMQEYAKGTGEIVREEIDAVGKQMLQDIKADVDIPVSTGGYRKSFKLKKGYEHGVYRIILYNKKYQLTHLLENGHRIIKKGYIDTGKRTKEHKHWAKAQATADTLAERIAARLDNNK